MGAFWDIFGKQWILFGKCVETIMWFVLYTFVEFVYPPTGWGGVNENPYAKLCLGRSKAVLMAVA